jgi:flagellar L-ring protein precursor FlgH
MKSRALAALTMAAALLPGLAAAQTAAQTTAPATSSDGIAPGQMLPGSEKAERLNPEIYDAMYERYLASARATENRAPTGGPSIDWMANLSGDPRARRLNDLVTIRVIESINGTGTADAALNKNSTANLATPKLFGVESKLPSAVDPTALLSASSDTKFKGGGVTTRTGALTAVMTTRVTEVLPNGDLVLEGVREIDINGDRQIIVLTGVVRQIDIASDNVVQSPSVGQLRIRYFGRGMMKDNLKPGFLVRMLNKIF